MLKFLLFAGIGCVGLVVAVAFYAAWKITKMGRDLDRGGVSGGGHVGGSRNRHDDYITTTGSTVHDWQNQHNYSSNDDSPSNSLSYSAGESIGSDIGSSATDFGSSDSGGWSDSGSSDSGSSDSGSSSSSD